MLNNANNKMAATDYELAIAEIRGLITESYYNMSKTRAQFDFTPLNGTNAVSGPLLGPAEVQAFGPTDAQAPDGTNMNFSEVKLFVDTLLMSRYSTRSLDKMLNNPNTMSRVAQRQGVALAVQTDEAIINMLVKASLMAPVAGIQLGGSTAVVADWTNGDAIEAAIRALVVEMEMNKEADVSDMVIYTTQDIKSKLLESSMLVSGLYSGTNANFSAMTIEMVAGMPIQVVSPKAFSEVNAAHKLGADYNVTADQAKAKLVIASAPALLVGEGDSLKTEDHDDKVTKLSHLDTTVSFGCKAYNTEYAGSLTEA